MKLYISFGQIHKHNINGKLFNKDTLAGLTCVDWEHGRNLAMKLFKGEFMTDYTADRLEMKYFPQGVIDLNGKDITNHLGVR